MDTEKGCTLIVTLKKVPQTTSGYEKLREAIGEVTGFDYVEVQTAPDYLEE